MKRRLVLLVVISLFLLCGCDAQKAPLKLTADDFTAVFKGEKGKIGIDSDVAILTELLGKPSITVTREDAERPEWTVKQYSWESARAEVFEGNKKINRLTLLNKPFSTFRGISVGDEYKKIKSKYPKPSVDTVNRVAFSYPTEDAVWGLAFKIDNGKVVEIDIARAP
jgi:hypothetical protein